ncbi:MAG: hypothetical protein AAF184_11855 [Pseudomonadota bacterium]
MSVAYPAPVYRRAHWYVLAVAIPTLAGFLPTYFGLFPRMQLAHHVHFWAATLWLVLLFAQPMLIARGNLSLHRTMGMVGIGVVIVFYATSMYVAWYSAGDAAAKGLPQQLLHWVDILAVNFALIAVVLAVVWRKTVAVHQRLMLATLFAGIVPGVGRALGQFVLAPAGLPGAVFPIVIFGGMILAALAWAWADRFKHPVTLGVLATVLVLSVSTFTIGASEWWREVLATFGIPQELYTPFRLDP